MSNSPEYIEVLYAVWHAGLTAVPMNAKLHQREFAYILENSGARLCFATIGRFALNADCTAAPGWDLGGEVDWSPDGSTILVLGTRNRGANFGLLAFTSNVPFSTHAADWGHGTLQTNASVPGQGVFAGEFSPDGTRMALVRSWFPRSREIRSPGT